MPLRIPDADGQVNGYSLHVSTVSNPRVCFVNGIQTPPRDHAYMAAYLSLLIERPVWGVYNKTAGQSLTGFVGDMLQCAADYTLNATARLSSRGHQTETSKIAEKDVPVFMKVVFPRIMYQSE